MEWTASMQSYIETHRREALELLITLAQIPAPSGHEHERAAFCRTWLTEQGAQGVYIDSAFNVIYPVGDLESGPLAVIAAHSDVVFPDTTPLPLTLREGRLACPGVGDDTANVVALLMAAKYIAAHALTPSKGGLLLVVDAGEEGLGNLKGMRRLFEDFGTRITECISLDCHADTLIDRAVGSRRHRIDVSTQGGHSYFDFGHRNAIAHLSAIVNELYKQDIPTSGTTYNVGVIHGGTSVNTIAQQAYMLYEYRSDDRRALDAMEAQFQRILAHARGSDVTVTATVLGDRPCAAAVDPIRQSALAARAEASIKRHFGQSPLRKAGSTDCNIPLSLGIPAVCFGCASGDGMHTREEYVTADSLLSGWKLALETVLYYIVG